MYMNVLSYTNILIQYIRSIMKEDKMKSNLDVKGSVYDDAAREAEEDFM
jgi:hypothetical protein